MTVPSVRPRDARDVRGVHAADVLLLLGYAVAAVAWLWPMPRHAWAWSAWDPGGFPNLATADFYLILWILSWVAHAVTRAPLHLFDANTFHPAPLALAYSEHLIGYQPLFAPVWWLTGNGVFALNVTAFLTYPLSAWFTYLFARRFLGRPGAAVAGAFFAFCALRYELPPHFHLLGVQWFPVILYALDAWLDEARTRDAVLLAVALLLQCLSSVYLLYATMFLGIAAAPVLLLEHRAALDRRRITGLAGVLAVTGAVVLVSMLPYLTLRSYGLVPDYDGELVPLGLIPMSARMHVRQYLAQGGVGMIGYLLALAALLPGVGSGARRVRRLGLALVLTGVIAALGPGIAIAGTTLPSPYALLMHVVPGFATVRQPARFLILAQLGFALLAGLGVARLVRERSALVQRAAAAACVAVALSARLALPSVPLHAERTPASIGAAERWLAANGGGRAVVELPRAPTEAAAARRAWLSTAHWLPILDGYGAYPPQHRAWLYSFADRLPDADALQDLVDRVDVGWVLVHRDQLSAAHRARWSGPLPDGLTLAAEWPDAAIYRVQLPLRHDLRDRVLSTERTLDGTPIAPLGERCAGALELVGWTPSSPVAGAEAEAQLRVVNHSEMPWPAAGFYPRNLVGARAVIRRPDGVAISKWRATLPHDPKPGELLEFGVELRAPAQPGGYLLHVDLVQDGVKPLRDCGTPTLVVPLDVSPKTTPAAR